MEGRTPSSVQRGEAPPSSGEADESTDADAIPGEATVFDPSEFTNFSFDFGKAELEVDPEADNQPDADAPPVATTTDSASKTATPPVPGANSFTESEARHRLEQHGYTTVSNLTKDDQGIWRGMAMKDGKSVPVALDYQGNIVSQ
jgi:hypothetical protein